MPRGVYKRQNVTDLHPRRGQQAEPETARQRFTRIGPLRVTKAVQAIRHLQNLGREGYEVKDKDVQQITSLLDAEVDEVRKALSSKGKVVPIVQFDE